jgi:SNF2 family DNA or RNA helicase
MGLFGFIKDVVLLPVDLALPFESIKVNILLNELSQLSAPHKALVFSQFTAMLDVLEEPLHRAGISFLRIDGQTPAAQRQVRVDQFQEREDISVMLISLKAGNAGLNLTAADYVFLIDPWWNTAVEQQAIDRTHRIGQQRKVFAYRLICRNTIEEKILQLQERKKQLADDLVGEEVGFVKSLTEDDIQFLLSD